MKKFLVLFSVLAMVVTIGTAQRQRYYLGPNLLFKGGVNAGTIPEGLKTGANFNGIPDFGLTFRYMFDKNSALGLLLDAQYATYSFRMRPESESIANDDNTIVFKPSYFTIAPGLYFSGVTFNVAIGFPASHSVQTVSGASGTGQLVANTSDLNGPAIELQLGGMIAAWKTDTGVLSVLIKGGYMVTGMYNDDAPLLNDNTTLYGFEGNNPTMASVSLGLNYLFDLGAL